MKLNKPIFIGIYITQYVVIYLLLLTLNRTFGLEISQHAFSIPMLITVLLTGTPLFFMLHKLEKSNRFIIVMSVLHYYIISVSLNTI